MKKAIVLPFLFLIILISAEKVFTLSGKGWWIAVWIVYYAVIILIFIAVLLVLLALIRWLVRTIRPNKQISPFLVSGIMAKVEKILYGLAKTISFSLLGLALALVLLLIALVVWDEWRIYSYVPEGKPKFTSTSPCRRFTVSAYSVPSALPRFAMPGQGGDGPAMFILRDNRVDKELQRQYVRSLWIMYAYSIDWQKDSVQLERGDGIFWRLPQNESDK